MRLEEYVGHGQRVCCMVWNGCWMLKIHSLDTWAELALYWRD